MASGKPNSKYGELAFWYGFFCLSSVSMILLNKTIAKSFRENGILALDNLLMIWQQCAAIGLNLICVQLIGGDTWKIDRITQEQVARLFLPSVNFVLMLICNLKGLKTVHVATVTVARNVCTVFVCIGEALVFQKYSSQTAVISLLIIIVGSVVYGYADISFEPVGYFWIACNSFLFINGQLYEKWAMGKSKKDQTALGISTIKNAVSLPVLGLIMLFQGDVAELRSAGISSFSKLEWYVWFCIVASGAVTCALSIAYMTLYNISSATAITVGGNFNKAISIFAGTFLFAQPMSATQCIGLLVSIGGSLWYSLEVSKPKSKTSAGENGKQNRKTD